MTLAQFERTLDPANPRHAAFHLAVRRAGPKASYAAFTPGVLPWHSAMAATYVHATAPLRRLADRFVIEATLQVANGQAVDSSLADAFQRLRRSWRKPTNARRKSTGRCSTWPSGDAGRARGRRASAPWSPTSTSVGPIQLSDPAVIARVDGKGAMPGDRIQVTLDAADPLQRQVRFSRVE